MIWKNFPSGPPFYLEQRRKAISLQNRVTGPLIWLVSKPVWLISADLLGDRINLHLIRVKSVHSLRCYWLVCGHRTQLTVLWAGRIYITFKGVWCCLYTELWNISKPVFRLLISFYNKDWNCKSNIQSGLHIGSAHNNVKLANMKIA